MASWISHGEIAVPLAVVKSPLGDGYIFIISRLEKWTKQF
jgi:hypothetical protein